MKTFSRTLKLLLVTVLALSVAGLVLTAWIIAQFPNDQEIRGCLTTQMYHVYLCPKTPGYTPLAEISPFLTKSVVLTEDSSFWTHHGFDFEEMQRSMKRNLEKGKYVRGGSTITQQLAKNLYLTEEKTLFRKFKEAIITLRLEQSLTKKEILERYLNVVHFGKDIFGVTKAAEVYFHKKPGQLNLVESAFLTFLLPSPEKYSVSFLKGQLTPFARKRLHQIIDSLFRYQRITDADFYDANSDLTSFLRKEGIDETQEALDKLKKMEAEEAEEPQEPEDN